MKTWLKKSLTSVFLVYSAMRIQQQQIKELEHGDKSTLDERRFR